MLLPKMSGVMRMYEKLNSLKKRLQQMKQNRTTRQNGQTFHFSTFSRKQNQVLTWWCEDSPVHDKDGIIADGAIRSGKTISMSLSFVMWAMHTFNGQNFAMCGKTIGSFRRNVLFWLKLMLKSRGYSVTDRRADNLILIRKGDAENYFYIFGGKDERSQDLIQGITLAGVLLDEAALMPRSFVEQAVARCSVRGSRLWFNCNPEGPEHWFYKEWIQRAEARGALRLHFTMEDNPGLAPEIRQRYERLYTGTFYRRFVLGQWAAAEGLVYDFFDSERDARPVPEGPFERWRVSVDYGTANPTSMGLWGEKVGVWYRVEEYYYDSRREGRQQTDAEYADALERLAAGRSIERVIVDPSAASFLEALRRRGYRVVKANNDVADGIRVTADLLRQGKIVICEGCRDCLRELAQYCWDEKAGKDAPRKEHDHAMDEMRYFAMDLTGKRSGGFAVAAVERRA